MRIRFHHRLSSAAAALLLVVLAPAAQAQVTTRFSLPEQSLADALRALGTQTNTSVVFDPTLVEGRRAPALDAQLNLNEALTRLLAGTGLTHHFLNARTVVLSPVRASQSSAKTSALSAGERNAAADRNGDLRLAQSMQRAAGAEQTDKPDASARPGEEPARTSVQEVIVTARKRSENLRDVPLSIAVLTADDIDRRGLVNAQDYLRGIPGVNQVEAGYGGQSIVIRGIETSPSFQNFSSGPTTATYFGETPTTDSAGLSSSTSVDLKLVDIERVEVLRGPQGTAFGNSSMGGAVRIIPAAPKLDRFEGKVAGGYSVTSGTGGDNYSIQAIGNIPLIRDRLAIRATAYQYDDSGFYRNRAGSDAAYQAAVVARYGAQAFAADDDEVGSFHTVGGRVSALFQATDDLRITLGYLTQKDEMDGIALATSGTYEQLLLQVAPEHVRRGQKAGINDTDIDLANATLEYQLGWANLVATYSYIKSGTVYSVPTGTQALHQPISGDAPSDHRQHVGEIRLATQLQGRWNFLAGLYAEKLDDQYFVETLWYGDPATNPYTPGGRFLGDDLDRRELRQKAAFGEVSWEFLPRFTLTGGVRAYDYERTVRTDTRGFFYGVNSTRDDAESSGTNFRGNLSYKPHEGALLYAGWSQGFRLGRPQPGLPAGLCDRDGNGVVDGTGISLASTRSLESDDVDSYELGGKFALFDRRLTIDAALFRMEWTGMPVRVIAGALTGGCGLAYNANAGKALSEGAELQLNFQISEPWRLDLGGSWLHARLTEDAPALNAFEGNRLPGSPEVNANLGLQYEFAIAGHPAFVRADSIYVGPFYGNLLETATTRAADYVKLDLSARVAIKSLNIDLFVRNVTDEDAFTFRGISAGRGELYGYRLRPRTIGLQLGYSF